MKSAATILVYRDAGVLHLAGPNPGTPYTGCGLDADAMKREEHPMSWAGMWCTECMKVAGRATTHRIASDQANRIEEGALTTATRLLVLATIEVPTDYSRTTDRMECDVRNALADYGYFVVRADVEPIK